MGLLCVNPSSVLGVLRGPSSLLHLPSSAPVLPVQSAQGPPTLRGVLRGGKWHVPWGRRRYGRREPTRVCETSHPPVTVVGGAHSGTRKQGRHGSVSGMSHDLPRAEWFLKHFHHRQRRVLKAHRGAPQGLHRTQGQRSVDPVSGVKVGDFVPKLLTKPRGLTVKPGILLFRSGL